MRWRLSVLLQYEKSYCYGGHDRLVRNQLTRAGCGSRIRLDAHVIGRRGYTLECRGSAATRCPVFLGDLVPVLQSADAPLQSIRLEHGQKVKILAINFVEKGDPVGFMKDLGYDFTVLPDGVSPALLGRCTSKKHRLGSG